MICGQIICYHVSAFVIPFNLICIMIIYFKLNFDLLTPTQRSAGGGGGVCRQNIWFHVAAFVILFNLICYMTIMTMTEKVEFDLLAPAPGSVKWVYFVIPFNLICYMTVL